MHLLSIYLIRRCISDLTIVIFLLEEEQLRCGEENGHGPSDERENGRTIVGRGFDRGEGSADCLIAVSAYRYE